MRRVWCGGRGANGRGGHGPSCLHRIMFFCPCVFFKGFRRGKDFRSACWLLLGSVMGPRCACRGGAVVVWYYDADMAEDANLTEGDMHLRARRHQPPRVSRYRRGQEAHQGLPFCLIGGAGGRQRGWEGTSNSPIVI